MKLNIHFGETPEPAEPGNILSEARARIIWGESSSSVRCFLTSNGIPDMDADAKIKEFSLERNAEIRRLGIKNILIGVALIGVCGIMLHLIYKRQNIGSLTVRNAKGFGVILLAGLYGLWKLVNGIIYLVRPQSEHESIPDLTE
jgi:hypothetical protein